MLTTEGHLRDDRSTFTAEVVRSQCCTCTTHHFARFSRFTLDHSLLGKLSDEVFPAELSEPS